MIMITFLKHSDMTIDKNTLLAKAAKFFAKDQNKTAKELHFTSDGQAFRNINAARGEASIKERKGLDDSILTISRAEAEAWAKEQGSPEPVVKAYKDMTVAELKAVCDEKKIAYAASAKKIELVGLLEQGVAEGSNSEQEEKVAEGSGSEQEEGGEQEEAAAPEKPKSNKKKSEA